MVGYDREMQYVMFVHGKAEMESWYVCPTCQYTNLLYICIYFDLFLKNNGKGH